MMAIFFLQILQVQDYEFMNFNQYFKKQNSKHSTFFHLKYLSGLRFSEGLTEWSFLQSQTWSTGPTEGLLCVRRLLTHTDLSALMTLTFDFLNDWLSLFLPLSLPSLSYCNRTCYNQKRSQDKLAVTFNQINEIFSKIQDPRKTLNWSSLRPWLPQQKFKCAVCPSFILAYLCCNRICQIWLGSLNIPE